MSARKNIPSPGGILPNGTVYEQIEINNTVQYAIKTDKGIQVVPFLSLGEFLVYQPISPSPWMLPPKPQEYGLLIELWQEIKQFVYEHLDIEDEKLYDVYVAFILVSWIPEKFDSVGYLHFHGPRNSGKTRGLDILNYLCFRPLESPSASGATIFRALDAYHPTFLLDEFEMYSKLKESKAEVIGIINSGYRRGQVVLRMVGMKEGIPTIKGFTVFGPKALSSIEPLPDALSSRCIRFPMTKTFRKIRRLVDKEKARELRGKLLYWRFSHDLDEPMVDDGNPIDLPDGRLIEMYYPLESVAPTPEIKETILSCGRSQYNMSIQEDRATREAAVFNIIIDVLQESLRLRVPQQELRDRYNSLATDEEKVTKQKFSGILKTLNIESKHNNRTRLQEIVVDSDILEARKNRYVLSEDMERVDGVLKRVRELQEAARNTLTTLDTVGTEDMGEGGQTPRTAVKPTVSNDSTVSTVPNVSTVPTVEPNLQERMEIVYRTLKEFKVATKTEEIVEKLGWEREEVVKLLMKLDTEGRAFRPRVGYWIAD